MLHIKLCYNIGCQEHPDFNRTKMLRIWESLDYEEESVLWCATLTQPTH